MIGGGALKAMNDSIKQNRELAKANKKKPFENSGTYKVSESLSAKDPVLSEEDRIKIAHATWQEDKADTRRKIIAAVLIALIVGAVTMTVMFTPMW